VHWGFYLIMIGLPLTGWVAVSASRLNIPTILFGQIPWPHLGFAVGSEPAFRAATTAHEILAWLTYALLALHVGAALKHQFLDRDNILLRMLPRLPARYRRSNIETR
jgi:cytochrome b561